MKQSLLCLVGCFLFVSTLCNAQKFQVDTLQKTGPIKQRINVVILGDGYTQNEMEKFDQEAKKFMDFFMSYDPYAAYRNYFNFFSIRTPSNQSGATNPGTAPDRYPDQPIETKDTFYGSTFGTNNIHRLVTIRNYQAFTNVMATNFPSYDLVVMIVNSTYYGGSGGGSLAVFTTNSFAYQVGVHEIAHAFSGLSDEYWAGAVYGRESPNMTQNKNPDTIKWKNWLNQSNVGIYAHTGDAVAASWYKPTSWNCMMEVNGKPLCTVCREATTNRILQLVNPVSEILPTPGTTVSVKSTPERFGLTLLKPNPNTLKVEWKLNDVTIGRGVDQITIANDQLKAATNTLRVTVLDTTEYIRLESHRQIHVSTYQWTLEKTVLLPPLAVSASRTSICSGESAVLSARNCTGRLLWSTSDTTSSISVSPTQSTTYSAQCISQDGTTQTASTSLTVFSLPVTVASNTGPYLEGQTIELMAQGGISYAWHGPMNFTSSEQNPKITTSKVTQSGSYTVTATDTNGCTGTSQTIVSVSPILSTNPFAESVFQLYPNPANRNFQIESTVKGELEFVLFDNAGREVLKKSFYKSIVISTESLPKSLYLYRLGNDSQTTTGKLLIE